MTHHLTHKSNLDNSVEMLSNWKGKEENGLYVNSLWGESVWWSGSRETREMREIITLINSESQEGVLL